MTRTVFITSATGKVGGAVLLRALALLDELDAWTGRKPRRWADFIDRHR